MTRYKAANHSFRDIKVLQDMYLGPNQIVIYFESLAFWPNRIKMVQNPNRLSYSCSKMTLWLTKNINSYFPRNQFLEAQFTQKYQTMEELIAKTIDFINRISNEVDQTNRSNIQNELNTFFLTQDFMLILANILISDHQIIIKRTCCNLFKDYVKIKYTQKESSSSEKKELIMKIFELLPQENIDLTCKEMICENIKRIFRDFTSSKIESEVKFEFFTQILSKQNFINTSELVGILIGFHALTETFTNLSYIAEFFRIHYDQFKQFLKLLMQNIIVNITEVSDKSTIMQPHYIQLCIAFKHLCKIVRSTLGSLVDFKSFTFINKVLNDPDMLIILKTLLDTQLNGIGLLTITGQQEVDDELNSSKSMIIEVYDSFTEYTFEKQKNVSKAGSEGNIFVEQLKINNKAFIEALFTFCKNSDHASEKLSGEGELNDLVTQILNHLSKCAEYQEFIEIYNEVYQQVIVHICFPLIVSSSEEIDNLMTDPREFFTYSQDVVYTQESLTPKAKAMSLLESICTVVDPAASYVLSLVLYLMDYSFSSGKDESIDKFDNLKDLWNSKFAINNSKEYYVEVSFMILTLMSHTIISRKDIMASINNLLKNHDQTLIHSSTILVKTRLIHFMSYYFQVISHFPSFTETAIKYLRFILDTLNNQEEDYEVIRYTSVSCIKNVFRMSEDKSSGSPGVESILSKVREELLSSLINQIEENDNDELLRIFTSLVKSRSTENIFANNHELTCKMIVSLVKRCDKEIDFPTLPNAIDLFVIEIWNIFKQISSTKVFIPQHAQILDNALVPLLKRLDGGKKLVYDDDIMAVMSNILELCKDLTPNLLKVVGAFPALFARHNHRVSFLLRIYNLLMKHKSTIFEVEKYLDDLIEICVKGLTTTCASLGDSFASEAAILLQISIMYLHSKLQPKHWKVILDDTCHQIYETRPKENLFEARLYGVLLSILVVQPKIVLAYLKENGTLTEVFDDLTKKSVNFETTYDKKLLVLGLIQLLKESMADGNLDQFSLNIIKYIGINLYIQHYQECIKNLGADKLRGENQAKYDLYDKLLKEQKQNAGIYSDKSGSNPLLNGYGPEDSEIFNYMLNDFNQNTTFSSQNLQIESPLDQEDEYKIFKDVTNTIKNAVGRDLLLSKFQEFGQNYMEALLHVLNTQRFTAQINQKEENISRRVVKRRTGVSKNN